MQETQQIDRPLRVAGWPYECASFVEMLTRRAREQPQQPALTFVDYSGREPLDAMLTYAQLDRKARQIATLLMGRTRTGDRALLLYHAGLEYVAAFLGCLYAGVIAVPLYPPLNPRLRHRLESVATDCAASIALASQPLPTLAGISKHSSLGALQWLYTDGDFSGLEFAWRTPELTRETCAFFQYTSGSSGAPKGVMVSHGNLLSNVCAITRSMQLAPEDGFFSWLPPYHDMGLIGGLLNALAAGIPMSFMAPAAFLRNPERWLQQISQRRSVLSGAPNFAYEMCVTKVPQRCLADLDLSSWDIAYSGAERVQQQTLLRFAERFSSCGFDSKAFWPCYGMAEATLLLSGSQRRRLTKWVAVQEDAYEREGKVIAAHSGEPSKVIVSCGRVAVDHELVIADPKTLAVLPDNVVGEIFAAGPSMAQGYWRRAQETQAAFHCTLPGYAHHFLRTGDLGFLRDGEVYVCGRLKDLIIIRGVNHFPHDIEATVDAAHPSIRTACGIAFSIEAGNEEQLVFVQEASHNAATDQAETLFAAIYQAILEQHQIQPLAIVLIEPGTIPRTTSRKLARAPCRLAYLNNELEVLANWFNPWLAQQVPASLTQPLIDESIAAPDVY